MTNDDWKPAAAAALDTQVAKLAKVLDEVGDAEELLETNRLAREAGEARAFAASLRAVRATWQDQARALRPPRDGMPLALTGGPTTRRLPRRPHIEEEDE
jgi:hypothetical protein